MWRFTDLRFSYVCRQCGSNMKNKWSKLVSKHCPDQNVLYIRKICQLVTKMKHLMLSFFSYYCSTFLIYQFLIHNKPCSLPFCHKFVMRAETDLRSELSSVSLSFVNWSNGYCIKSLLYSKNSVGITLGTALSADTIFLRPSPQSS